MRRIALVVAAALLLTGAMASTADAAPGPPPDDLGGSINSVSNRSNASGTGNFGQCLRVGAVLGSGVLGQFADELNPSPANAGEADCRSVAGLNAIALANCNPGDQPTAETQINYQPPTVSVTASCQ